MKLLPKFLHRLAFAFGTALVAWGLAVNAMAAPMPDFILPDQNNTFLAGSQTKASPRQGGSVQFKEYRE